MKHGYDNHTHMSTSANTLLAKRSYFLLSLGRGVGQYGLQERCSTRISSFPRTWRTSEMEPSWFSSPDPLKSVPKWCLSCFEYTARYANPVGIQSFQSSCNAQPRTRYTENGPWIFICCYVLYFRCLSHFFTTTSIYTCFSLSGLKYYSHHRNIHHFLLKQETQFTDLPATCHEYSWCRCNKPEKTTCNPKQLWEELRIS